MDGIQKLMTRVFDLGMSFLEGLGVEWAILITGGVFGVLALWIFKWISPQKAIRATKERIKGHMIEIRLYQNDLRLVTRAIGKVMWNNLRYLGLNLGPFLPLAIPFVFVAGQLVVRYAFDPVPVAKEQSAPLAGEGQTLRVETTQAARALAADLTLVWPEGIQPVSALVQNGEQGMAFQEWVAVFPGMHEIEVRVGGETSSKRVWAGDPSVLGRPRAAIQPARTSGWARLLWPAEDGLDKETNLTTIHFPYPESRLGWLPGAGPTGVLLWFIVASMVFGLLALKPLRVTI